VSDPPDTEAELIRLAQAGDVAAFRQLAQRQQAFLFACAYTLCRDRHGAEDLAQEALVAAWRSLARFDGRCKLSSWLYGILKNRYLKAGLRRGTASIDDASPETLPHHTTTPAQDAEQAEDAAQVRAAVASLPDEHRQVIELRFFAGASLEEIAGALDCPLGTVKSRLHHGLEKLRMKQFEMNLFPSDRESRERSP
jgi:RNA polymerase sigma-70 factor, ECF subfamily